MADWLDLPQDLLERISGLFIISDPRISPDFIRMRSVCKSWRSILKYGMPRELPWLMMLPNNNSSKNNKAEEEEEEEEEEKGNPPPDGGARLFYSPSNQKIHTISLPEIRGKRCCGSFQNGWLMIVDDKLDIFIFHPWSKKKNRPPSPVHLQTSEP
ncbi:hypothetical protein MRB53_023068 [Persea americana]|uniref:Uncharacterized protein n=1 Tax=Persea americana TaxID=3435 RepID=A0ACC2L8H5_PERAE|nr:hypothetical protein MRB53_023068 [Persea americana]